MSGSSYAHLTGVFKPKAAKKSSRGVPVKGTLSIIEWAEEFEISSDQFGKWVSDYEIPYFKPGKRMYIRAEDLWPRLPFFTHFKDEANEGD
jgi:hypothetical protein